eukprot:Pgem_evm1s17277
MKKTYTLLFPQGSTPLQSSKTAGQFLRIFFSVVNQNRCYVSKKEPKETAVDEEEEVALKNAKEKNKTEHDRLRYELKRGYFGDFNEMQRTKGKIFASSDELSAVSESPIFPVVLTKSVTSDPIGFPHDFKEKCSLVSFIGSESSRAFGKSFSDPFWEKYCNDKDVQLYEFTVLHKYWKFLARLMGYINSRMEQSPERKKKLIVQGAGKLPEILKWPNRIANYHYLIDSKGRIRWKATGQA